MTLEERVAELEERVAYLESELGLAQNTARESLFRQAFGLTGQEARLVMALYDVKGRILSKYQLEDAIQRVAGGTALKIADVYVCRVRKRMGYDAIETVWGLGYKLTPKGVAMVDAIEQPKAIAA